MFTKQPELTRPRRRRRVTTAIAIVISVSFIDPASTHASSAVDRLNIDPTPASRSDTVRASANVGARPTKAARAKRPTKNRRAARLRRGGRPPSRIAARPTTAKPAIAKPTSAKPAIARPTTAKPATAAPPTPTAVSDPTISTPEAKPAVAPLRADIGFLPEQHSFSFANWAAATDSDNADLSVARRLFGDSSVCAQVDGSNCIPYPGVDEFLERLNAALDKGRCEGMVVLAFERLRAGTPHTLTLVKEDIIDDLNYWSATQILPAAKNWVRETRGWDIARIVAAIREDFGRGGGAVLGMYMGENAHSVLPISIEISDTVVNIGLYDPNYPMVSQVMVVDAANGTWSYTALNADGTVGDRWSGSAIGGLSLVPIAARAPAEITNFKR